MQFIFDHVTFIPFKICCCIQYFMKIWWFFNEIWQYNNFQNNDRPPSWNCLTTIRDHPRSVCCSPQLPVKFHVNLIHRSKDIATRYLNFSHIWLEMPIQAPKMRVLGDFGFGSLNVIIHHRDHKRHISLRKFAYFKPSTVKIRWGVWLVGQLTWQKVWRDTQTHRHKLRLCVCVSVTLSVTQTHTQVNLYSV